MATVSYETGLPNVPKQSKKHQKIWKCKQCGRMHEHMMEDLSAEDVECEECGQVNRITFVADRDRPIKAPLLGKVPPRKAQKSWECSGCGTKQTMIMNLGTIEDVRCEECGTKRKLIMPHNMPEKHILPNSHTLRRKISKSWICIGCKARYTNEMLSGDKLTIKCGVCGVANQISLPPQQATAERIFKAPSEQRVRCAECGFIHSYIWGHHPEVCEGCGADMLHIEQPKKPPYYNKPIRFTKGDSFPKKKRIFTGKAGNCESIW